jgi:hypothetical protein
VGHTPPLTTHAVRICVWLFNDLVAIEAFIERNLRMTDELKGIWKETARGFVRMY